MVHQQGIQGAIEHYTHPERVAWQVHVRDRRGHAKGRAVVQDGAFGETFFRNGRTPSEVWRRYKVATSLVSGQHASITSPTGSAWRRTPRLRTARLLRHPLEAKLVVPRPSPTAIFERLSLMRDIVWLPQMVSFLSLPLLSSLKAVE